MKKLLMVVLAFVGVTCTAWADGMHCTEIKMFGDNDNLGGMDNIFAKVYFDTSKSQIQDCDNGKLVGLVESNREYIEKLVVIGMADRQGSGKYDNVGLAKKRAEFVAEWFPNVAKEIYDAGDSNAKAYSSKVNDPEYRSVDIYVIWKLPVCDEETMGNIKLLKESLASYTGSEKKQLGNIFAELDKICNKHGNPLTASDSGKYTKLLSELARLVNKIKKENPSFNINTEAWAALRVNAAYANLSQTRNNLGLTTSKWKNAEGKFNTARLVSDSVAGVVLGTAGGLITSHLVKKGQVKSGFEDIRCTIGGQQVADWGDEFTVGIR